MQHQQLEPNEALGLQRGSDSGSNEENGSVCLTRCAPTLPMILLACTVFCEDAVVYADRYDTAMSLCHAAAVEGWAHVDYVFYDNMRTRSNPLNNN